MTKLKLKGVRLCGKVLLNYDLDNGGENPPPFIPYKLEEQSNFDSENVGDLFGFDIASNSKYLAVGAYGANSANGAVYIYEKMVDGFNLVSTINPPEGITSGRFGYSLDMTENWLVVSAPAFSSGMAFVYQYIDGVWSTVPTTTFSAEITGTFFGSCVGIDGNVISIGQYNANSGVGGDSIYTLSNGSWTKEYMFYPSMDEIVSRVSRPYFGYSLDVKGSTVVIGGPGNSSGTGIGTAVILSKISGSWVPTYLSPSETSSSDGFGASVSMQDTLFLIGSPASSNYSGHLYKMDGTIIKRFKIGTMDGDIIDPTFQTTNRAGYAVAIKNTKDVIAIGSYNNQTIGAVYIFQIKDGEWIPAENTETQENYSKLVPSLQVSNSRFGCSLEFIGNDLLIGAFGTNIVQGKVYHFVS